jgi:hypothetical protein
MRIFAVIYPTRNLTYSGYVFSLLLKEAEQNMTILSRLLQIWDSDQNFWVL